MQTSENKQIRQPKYLVYKNAYQRNCRQEKIKMKKFCEMIGVQKITQEGLPQRVPNE